ncbi:MAG: sulfurtransferase TusA family protein [Nitrospiraceae bacterium]|nr:sulfurtransferase TusA family protein [Nitrospiraceae bacterium]
MPQDSNQGKKLDIRGLVCPYTFVKAKLAIEDMEMGGLLEILLDYPEAVHNIPKSMQDHGHKVLKVEQTGIKEWIIVVRKEKD